MYHEHALVCPVSLALAPSSLTTTLRRNTQIEDTCIVFRQWHISSKAMFAFSFFAVVLISVGYEWLRAYQKSVDVRIALALSRGKGRGVSSGRSSPGMVVEEEGLLSGRTVHKRSNVYVTSTSPRQVLRRTMLQHFGSVPSTRAACGALWRRRLRIVFPHAGIHDLQRTSRCFLYIRERD